MANHLLNSTSGNTISIFGGRARGSGAVENDLWFRLPKAQFIKYAFPQSARLEITKNGAFYFPKAPNSILMFIVQWINNGGKDPTAPNGAKYPTTDVFELVALHEAALDLGIQGLIERAGADVQKINDFLFRSSTRFTRGGAHPRRNMPNEQPAATDPEAINTISVRLPEILPPVKDNDTITPYPKPVPTRNTGPVLMTTLPFSILAQDSDGLWLIHCPRGRVRTFSNPSNANTTPIDNKNPAHSNTNTNTNTTAAAAAAGLPAYIPRSPQGTLKFMGVVESNTRQVVRVNPSIVVVARWRQMDWKVEINAEGMKRAYEIGQLEDEGMLAGRMSAVAVVK